MSCRALLALLIIAFMTGCGESGGIDENKPLDQVAAEAAQLSKEKLQSLVSEYEALIAEKTEQLKDAEAQIKNLSISDLMGENAQNIKEETKNLSTSIRKLNEQLAVYAKQLAAAGE